MRPSHFFFSFIEFGQSPTYVLNSLFCRRRDCLFIIDAAAEIVIIIKSSIRKLFNGFKQKSMLFEGYPMI